MGLLEDAKGLGFSSLVDDARSLGFEDDATIAERNLEERGDINRGLRSGYQRTVGLLAGAAGAAADAVGADDLAQKGYDEYQRRENLARLNPGTVEKVEDIDGFGDAVDWLQYNVAGQVPNLISIALSGGATGILGKKILGTAAKKAVEGQVKKGIARDVAEKAVARKITSTAAKIGVGAGAGALETGGMWATDVEKFGVEGSSPVQDIAFGALSGATELISPTGRLAALAAGARKVGGEQAATSLLKRVGLSIPKNAIEEGGQEVVQELISKVNERIKDPNVSFTDKEALSEMFNAFAVGAAMGGISGPIEAIAPTAPPEPKATPEDVLKADTVDEAIGAFQDATKTAGPEAAPTETIDDYLSTADDISLSTEDITGAVQSNALRQAQEQNRQGQRETTQAQFEQEIDRQRTARAVEEYSPDVPDITPEELAIRARASEPYSPEVAEEAARPLLPPGQGFELVGGVAEKTMSSQEKAEAVGNQMGAAIRFDGVTEGIPGVVDDLYGFTVTLPNGKEASFSTKDNSLDTIKAEAAKKVDSFKPKMNAIGLAKAGLKETGTARAEKTSKIEHPPTPEEVEQLTGAKQEPIVDENPIPQEVKSKLLSEAQEESGTDPIFAQMASAKKRGGLNLNSLQDYPKETINQIQKRYPGLISNDGKLMADEFADSEGMTLDQFVERMKSAPTKTDTERKAYQEKKAAWQTAEREQAEGIEKEVTDIIKAVEQGASWATDKTIASDDRFSVAQRRRILAAQKKAPTQQEVPSSPPPPVEGGVVDFATDIDVGSKEQSKELPPPRHR